MTLKLKYVVVSVGVIVSMLLALPAGAKVMYVTDSFEIMVRTGPSLENKIIAILKSNEAVEVLEEQDGWIRVRLENGKEGYVLTRFLTSKIPTPLVTSELEKKLRTLEGEVKDLGEDKERLEKLVSQQEVSLRSKEQELTRVEREYEALKSGATDYVRVKKRKDELAVENTNLKGQIQGLLQENTLLKRRKDSLFFASGGGVLLVGWLLGFIMARAQIRRKRRMFYN